MKCKANVIIGHYEKVTANLKGHKKIYAHSLFATLYGKFLSQFSMASFLSKFNFTLFKDKNNIVN